ncbi:MAG: peptidoglycan editing factor PgeF [Veillonellales bacterium]
MKPFLLQHSDNGVWYGFFPRIAALNIKHGLSSRLGGLSVSPYHTLNLGLHTGDQAEQVVANRRLFCQALNVDPLKIVTAEQVHGEHIHRVTLQDAGRGAEVYEQAIPATDALITNIPGLPLLLFFADCVPVLIADPVHRAVAISHAGWKGTVAKIAQKTIIAMQTQFNTQPADCVIGIAPSIGPCCYQVGENVVSQVKRQFPQWTQLLTQSEENYYLNLWEANRVQLMEIGVPADNIVVSDICTACNSELFYSYRADHGRTGRIGAIITL